MNLQRSRVPAGALLLLVLLFAQTAFGKGTYQRTKDGKTLVWNNYPRSGEEVTWSGNRDKDGYATGRGALTWYRVERALMTGSNIPSGTGRSTVIGQYSGKMIRGKLDGTVVVVDEKGRTFHGTFADGSKSDDWVPGPAPAPAKKAVEQPALAQSPAPATTPALSLKSPSAEVIPAAAAVGTNAPLQSLTAPPSSLHVAAVPVPSASPAVTPVAPAKPAMRAPSPSPSPISASASDDEKAVAGLDTQYQAAVKANDAETMDRILSEDFVLVTGRGRVSTKADLLKAARAKLMTYEHQEEEEGTQKVRVWGDTAVVTARLWVRGTEDGTPVDYKVWFSDTYTRTPKGWRYAFGQASTPSAKPDAK